MAGYSVTFSVVDNATKQIDAINRRMTAMRAPMDRLSKQVSRFVDVSGLRTIERGFTSIASAAGKVLRTLVEIVPVMGALTGAATIGGMAKLVSTYAAWSQSLTRTADNLGLTTQQLQQFEDATRLAGGNVSDMDSALKSLYKVQSDFLRGQASADQIGWLNRLGISMRDANGHARNMADLMPEVIRKIAAIKNPADRAAASAALLGDANSNLVNTFRQSHQSFAQWMTDASRYTELTDKQKDQLQSFAEAQGRVATAFDHLGQQVSATLAKNFTPFLNMISDFVEKHQGEIIAAVDNISKKFSAWLENPETWKSIEKGLADLIHVLTWVSTHLDTIKDAAEAVAVVFAVKWGVQGVAAALQLAAAVAKITTAIGSVGAGGGGAAAAAGGVGLLGALGAVAAIAGGLFAAGAVAVENKKLNKTMDEQAAEMGFQKKGGSLWNPFNKMPTFFNPKTGETLSYGDMQKRLGYGPSGMNPFQPDAGRGTPAPGPMNLPTDNIKRGAAIRDRLSQDLGITGAQASGIVGNLQAESGLQAVQEKNPIGGGRGGFGWAQWTGPRRVAFEEYAKSHALSPTSDEANYGFLVQELKSKEYAGTLAKLRQEKTASGSAASFEANFERPAVSNAGTRGRYADQYAAAAAPVPPTQLAQAPAAPMPPMQIAQGPPASVPPPTPVNGKVDVAITGKNLPPDSAVTAKGSGAVNVPPPRVEHQEFSTI